MDVVAVRAREDCFDGSIEREVELDREVDAAFVRYLGGHGDLEYHPDFARPFYRLDRDGAFIAKGVEGNRTVRLILERADPEGGVRVFREIVKGYGAPSRA